LPLEGAAWTVDRSRQAPKAGCLSRNAKSPCPQARRLELIGRSFVLSRPRTSRRCAMLPSPTLLDLETATWLLRDFIHGYEGDGMIPCIVIPSERASVFRQAKENTARTGLSAIAMARQAALLLLTVHGFDIPDYPVTHDFYRQALELDLRGKREYTDAILAAMGGIRRMQLSHYKALLRRSDEAMELADRHNLDERKLRPIISLSPELHVEIVRQIVDFNLTSRQVEELCLGDSGEDVDTDDEIPASARKVARVAQATATTSPQDIARALIQQEGDMGLARARLQAMRRLLADAELYLTE